MKARDELFSYIKESLNTDPDYPFSRAQHREIAIFRHSSNRKWFAAVIPQVSFDKLGLPGEGSCDVVDLKSDPFLSGSLRGSPGILPGYHMNKEHWITVLLDGSVKKEMLFQLVDMSYGLTASQKKYKKHT